MMVSTKNLWVAAFLAIVALTPTASRAAGPAIDCRHAFLPAELEICRFGYLSALDQQMAGAYLALYSRLGPQDRTALQASQKQWERYRNGCGGNQGCLRAVYAKRMSELQNWQ